MILIVGCALGLGLVLSASPFLWPAAAARSFRAQPRLVTRLRDRLAQAGLPSVSVTLFVVVSAIVALAVGAVTFALVPVVALAVAGCLGGLSCPLLVVNWRARSRQRAARVLWPDVVDHLVSAVRSGLALPDSVVSLAQTGPSGSREAFAAFAKSYAATGNFSLCLDGLKQRLADPIADRILETLRMAREVGGSELTGVLHSLGSSLRQEAAIRDEVEARQSWVINAAKLGVAAPWIILVLLSTRPEAAAAYNTTAGVTVIVAGFLVSLVAYRAMLAVGRLPQERRWFQ
jgi:tight adherence protein B